MQETEGYRRRLRQAKRRPKQKGGNQPDLSSIFDHLGKESRRDADSDEVGFVSERCCSCLKHLS